MTAPTQDELDKFLHETVEKLNKQRNTELVRFVLATAGSIEAAHTWAKAGWKIETSEDIGYEESDGHVILKAKFYFKWHAPDELDPNVSDE